MVSAGVVALGTRSENIHIHDPELLWFVPIWKLFGRHVVYDVHEDYTSAIRQKPYLPNPLRRPLSLVFDLVERLFARMTTVVIAERYYRERFPNAIEVLNYPARDLRQASELPRALVQAVSGSRWSWYVYAGNVTEDRGAFHQLRILELRDDTAVAYVGYTSGALYRRVREYLQLRNINPERFVAIGVDEYVPHDVICAALARLPWAGALALFPDTEHYRRKELTKIYEYMRFRLRIVASDFPVWRSMIAAHYRAYALADPGDDASILRALGAIERWTDPDSFAIKDPVFEDQIPALLSAYRCDRRLRPVHRGPGSQ